MTASGTRAILMALTIGVSVIAAGGFFERTDALTVVWTSHDIGSTDWPQDLVIYDIDGDGDADVAATDETLPSSGTVIWFENPGNPSGTWTKRVIFNEATAVTGLDKADINGDGRIDLVAAAQFLFDPNPCSGRASIAWFENPANPKTMTWPRHRVACVGDPSIFAEDVVAVDVDGDSDIDVAAAMGYLSPPGQVAWFANSASGGTWTKYLILDGFDSDAIVTAQIFGDAKPDLFVGESGRAPGSCPSNLCDIVLFVTPTDPTGSWGSPIIIDNDVGQTHQTGLFPIDVDREGDLDLVAGLSNQNKIAWYEKPASPSDPWVARDIGTLTGVRGVAAGAVDSGDVYVDVLGLGYFGSPLMFFKGPELPKDAGATWTPETVDTQAGPSRAVAVFNLDGGIPGLEVVAGIPLGDEVRWYDRQLVNNPPVAEFTWTPTTPAEGQPVTLTDQSTDSDGTIVAWSWDFGEGAGGHTSTLQNPTHTWGDDGAYTITLNVTDSDGATASRQKTIMVTNVAPTASWVTPPNSPSIEGGTTVGTARSVDPGSDDLTFTWSWGYTPPGGPPAQTVVTYYNDGSPPPDPDPSSHGEFPFDRTNGQIHQYGDNGAFTITLTVADDDGGSNQVSSGITVNNANPVIQYVNSTLFPNRPRTHGYWKHQCTIDPDNPPSPDHVGIKPAYIAFINANSRVWATANKDAICADLNNNDPAMLKHLRMQLIAVWLNVAAKFLHYDSPLHDSDTPANTVRLFLQVAEDAIISREGGSPLPPDLELEKMKNVAERINKANWAKIDPVVGVIVTAVSDAGSDDLMLEFDFDGTTGNFVVDRTVFYCNNGVACGAFTDPLPSPWGIFPFAIIDVQVVGFPLPPGTFEPRVRVTDDDGGMAIDQNPIEPWSANWRFYDTVSETTIYGGFVVPVVTVTYLEWDAVVVRIDPYTGQPMP